jgi:putative radical SAM enzyme (TIGR03279 family)
VTATRLKPIGAPGDLIQGVELLDGQPRQYGHKNLPRGGVIDAVEPGSPCDRAGVRPGDILLRVNGHKLRDAIDYQFFSADEEIMRLDLVPGENPTQTQTLVVERRSDELPGISFTEPTFSPIRECNNHCPFCFIDQLPAAMRSSLYIRDDDYRYSFLFGNFVTLTNLNERDWKRLEEQRLSPLYVSVHATDLEMRRLLLGNNRAPDIMLLLRRLFSIGIRVHAQIVTCPGINDGAYLEQTVRDLAEHFPDVLSIGVVPVGLTRTPSEILAGPGASCSRILPSAADLPLRTFRSEEAHEVVRKTRRWQRRFRQLHDCSVVYASDELYLLCDEPVPSARSYDEYPQFENGIGMVRDLIDDFRRTQRRIARGEKRQAASTASLVCGDMIGGTLGRLIEEWRDLTGAVAQVVVVENEFFGPRVRVSGLLTGRDIVSNAHHYAGEVVILPAVMLDKTGTRLLDGMTPAELEEHLGKPVRFAAYLSDVDRIVFEGASDAAGDRLSA